MEQNLHWNWFLAQKIEHSNENKINLVFRHLTHCSIFASLLFLVYFNCKLFCWSVIYFYRFASKIILFQKALQFKAIIILCYIWQTIVWITSRVLPPLTWHISQIIIDVFSSFVNAYVLNQYCGHGLFFDVLNAMVTSSLKLF